MTRSRGGARDSWEETEQSCNKKSGHFGEGRSWPIFCALNKFELLMELCEDGEDEEGASVKMVSKLQIRGKSSMENTRDKRSRTFLPQLMAMRGREERPRHVMTERSQGTLF